ncbi:hypothetical protein BJ742DRAFT_736233 [Cladochytrium replicatum]|nr:hypothetical protein BJ742DRAFT_736233 [Cladochytrium replicatum]
MTPPVEFYDLSEQLPMFLMAGNSFQLLDRSKVLPPFTIGFNAFLIIVAYCLLLPSLAFVAVCLLLLHSVGTVAVSMFAMFVATDEVDYPADLDHIQDPGASATDSTSPLKFEILF